MSSSQGEHSDPAKDRDRDLIASMNEANSFEELETLTRMARARLNRRGSEPLGAKAPGRLRRALPFTFGG